MTDGEKKVLEHADDALDKALAHLLESASGEWDLSRRFDQALDGIEKEIWHAKKMLALILNEGKNGNG